MKHLFMLLALSFGLIVGQQAQAQAQIPAKSAPADATGLCKDGTYTNTATKKGACRGHKGVKEWYGAASTATPATPAAPAAATPAPAAAAATSRPATQATPAPGGGAGQVWVNTSTKVYHCPGDQWYGKTKQGSYMTEAAAIAAGAHASHGKACSK